MYTRRQAMASQAEATRHLLSSEATPEFNDEKNGGIGEHNLSESIRTLRAWLAGVSALLAVTLLAMALMAWHYGSTGNAIAHKLDQESFVPPSKIKNANKLKHILTITVPSHIVTFERNELFSAPSTPEADQAWGSLSPPGDGFVVVPNPREYGLPLGKPSHAGEVFDISVFHQLHCLNHLRTFLFTLKAGLDLNNTREVYDRLLVKQEDHVYHCFDLIRQALMCHPDLTVEWPRTEADGRRFAFDGWGIQHQCVDWNSVLGFMSKHSVTNTAS